MKQHLILLVCIFLFACNSAPNEAEVEQAVNMTLTAVAQEPSVATLAPSTATIIPPTPTIAPSPAVSETETETNNETQEEPTEPAPNPTAVVEEQSNAPATAPETAQTPTTAPTATTPSASASRLEGTVTFADGSQPQTAVYAISTDTEFGLWYFELLNAGTSTFSIEVEPDTYTVVAWVIDGSQAAAYTNTDHTLATVTVGKKETISNINVIGLLTGECNKVTVPSPPDGRYPAFPAQNGNCDAQGNKIQAQGEVTLTADDVLTNTNTTALFDLDLSGDPLETAADIELLIVNNGDLAPSYAIQPRNNSILLSMGAGEPGKSGCETASGYTSKSTPSVIIANYICVQTSNGRYVQIRIDALTLITEGRGQTTLSFTIWE